MTAKSITEIGFSDHFIFSRNLKGPTNLRNLIIIKIVKYFFKSFKIKTHFSRIPDFIVIHKSIRTLQV